MSRMPNLYEALTGTRPRSKYGAQPVVIDGIRFASKREGKRYIELKLMERAGEIRDLKLQPKFPMVINGQKVCEYWADFSYWPKDKGLVVEDVKGVETDAFVIKRKLLKAVYGLDVVIVR